MIIRLSHPSCPTVYEIRPNKGGLCYEIFKNPDTKRTSIHSKTGKTYTRYGDPVGRYPSTLKHAIEMTIDLMQKNPKTEGQLDIDLSKETEEISTYYKEWLDALNLEERN